jgi:hypothetical protein
MQRPFGAKRALALGLLAALTGLLGPAGLVGPVAAAADEHDVAEEPDAGDRLDTDPELAPEPLPPSTTSLEARGIDRVCPPPTDRGMDLADPIDFPDIGATHASAITCASVYRLIGGFADGTVRPGIAVTRAQTASVVRAWLELATGFELTVPAEQPFPDVAGTHADAIAALEGIGVIAGRTDGTFDPDGSLTRGQFSRVVANAISYADVFRTDGPLPAPPPPDTSLFTDVEGTTFEDDILALAAARITTGTGDGRFSPAVAVTRGQLATFLMRSADYLDRHQRWRPTARTAVLVAELTGPEDRDDDGTDDPVDDELGGLELPPRATVTLLINAFNGTLAFVADVSDVPALRDPDAALRLRLGPVDDAGPAVLRLADAAALGASDTGLISGTLVEVDSSVRFADLMASPDTSFVELAAEDLPGGALRGALSAAN